MSYFNVLFWEDCILFSVQKEKLYFREKFGRNSIFSFDTGNIVFQCNFCWRTTISKHLEKRDKRGKLLTRKNFIQFKNLLNKSLGCY